MGNESSLTKDCKLEREIPVESPKIWRLYESSRKDGSGTLLSVFVYEPQKQELHYIENAAKYLKILRHPSIIKFIGLERTSDGVWLATEQVTPLENKLDDMSSSEIVAGIYSILEAIVFLHDRGGLCHNNLTLSSIFVSEDGSWKLGGMEYLCRFDQATGEYLAKCKRHREEASLAPEEKCGKVDLTHPGWARDAYSFATLIEMFLEYISDHGDMTKTFEIRIQDECMDPDPNRRPKLNTFLQDVLFKNEFLQIFNFLKNVTLKSEEDKKKFFSDLVPALHQISEEVLATRLVRPLLSRFVLLDATACEKLLPHILSPYIACERPAYRMDEISPLLSDKSFRRYVVPELVKIFHVRDVHIRSILLEHFTKYVDYLDKNVLQQTMLPQLLLGVRDTNDELVCLSLHAIAELVPILGANIVVGPNRLKLFVEATPKFGGKPALSSSKTSVEVNGSVCKDVSPPPGKVLEEEDLDRDADRQRRREETKRKNEERRKRRQEREKTLVKEYDEEISSKTRNLSEWDGNSIQDVDIARKAGDNSDIQLESIDVKEAQFSPSRYPHNGAISNALKLKSSKMRTSPPPQRKMEDNLHIDDAANQASDMESETWAEGGEDDQWNSESWQDLDDPESFTSQHSNKSPPPNRSSKHSESLPADKLPTSDSKTNRLLSDTKHTSKPKVADIDIMALDIKTSSKKESNEFDFFADMKPDIKVHSKDLWGVLKDNKNEGQTQGHGTDDLQKPTTLSFAVNKTLTDEAEGAGWGEEDLDWGTDEL